MVHILNESTGSLNRTTERRKNSFVPPSPRTDANPTKQKMKKDGNTATPVPVNVTCTVYIDYTCFRWEVISSLNALVAAV